MADWLKIVLGSVGSVIGGLLLLLVRRYIQTVETLRGYILNPTGPVRVVQDSVAELRLKLASSGFVTAGDIDVQVRDLSSLIERNRVEAMAREERILASINAAREANTAENRDLRTEITGTHRRIDALVENKLRA